MARNKMMRYLKNYWNESQGDEYDSWGNSTYYFELGQDDYPVRQIIVYDNGNSLKYRFKDIIEDKYGFLSDKPILNEEIQEYNFTEIPKDEFEKVWNESGMIDQKPQWPNL